MTYTDKTKKKYSDLPTMLSNESIKIADYYDFDIADINWLVNRGTLTIDDEGILHVNKARATVLKDIFYKEVLCYSYENYRKELIDKLIECNDLRFESSLFSKPEQDYLDYMLNNSKYGNGPALRNKYVHGSYPLDIKENEQNYYELLKIMVLIIIKINEEFCLTNPIIND